MCVCVCVCCALPVCSPSEVGSLRSTAHFLWSVDFSPHVLRNRLNRCLAAKGLHTIITFDAQLDHPMLLKAIWLVDTQQWTEVADALKLAAQYGHCQLPVTCDLQRHDSKQVAVIRVGWVALMCLSVSVQAYSADVRVIALWKMVGRHVEFGGNYGRFELFDQPGGGVRALRDAPGFELDINPPLPPTHPYHPHIIDGNPPVRSSIDRQGDSWTAGAEVTTDASVSAFIMRVIMWPANWGGHAPVVLVDRYAGHTTPHHTQTHTRTSIYHGLFPLFCVGLFRHAHGGVLDGLMNHLPHSPPNGCSAVMAHRFDDMVPPAECRTLLLTPFDRPFVAWIDLIIPIETNTGKEGMV